MDFTENSIIWGVYQSLLSGLPASGGWVIIWKTVQHLSYWLPFIAALFAAPALWGKTLPERLAALAGSLLVLAALLGMYVPALSLLSNLWFLLWFAALALLLWCQAANSQPV